MEQIEIKELDSFLRRLVVDYADILRAHHWVSEQSRWAELVFALCSKTSHKKDQGELRAIIYKLDKMMLLRVDDLAKISKLHGEIEIDDQHAKPIFRYLVDNGFTEKDAKSSILAICEVAESLQTRYGGKIQNYLRFYGDLMIKDLPDNFKSIAISKKDLNYVFTYWLQNVLNMPISLKDENIDKFCSLMNVDYIDLARAADKIDLNLAVLDELIGAYITDLDKEKE